MLKIFERCDILDPDTFYLNIIDDLSLYLIEKNIHEITETLRRGQVEDDPDIVQES